MFSGRGVVAYTLAREVQTAKELAKKVRAAIAAATSPAEIEAALAMLESKLVPSDDPTEYGYSARTLTDPATGITVAGIIHDSAALTVKDNVLHFAGACAACDAIRQHMTDGSLMVLFGKDISLSSGFAGTLTITFPVGSAYNGKTVTVLHCNSGMLETLTTTVKDGKATISVTSLSPFAVFVSRGQYSIPQTGEHGAAWIGWLMCGIAAGFGALAVRRKMKPSRG